MKKPGLKIFVQFTTPHDEEDIVRKMPNRSIRTLKIPENALSFVFFSAHERPNGAISRATGRSYEPLYVVGRIQHRDALRNEAFSNPAFIRDMDRIPYLSLVFMEETAAARRFIVMRNGTRMPLPPKGEDYPLVVITPEKKQVWPRQKTAPAKKRNR